MNNALPHAIPYRVASIDQDDAGNRVLTIEITTDDTLAQNTPVFVETENNAQQMIGVTPYGAYYVPANIDAETMNEVVCKIGANTYKMTTGLKGVIVGKTGVMNKV